MVKQKVTVTNETGLHARPASEFIKLATGLKCGVFIEKEGRKVNSKSILGVLSLAIGQGNEIEIITDGEDEVEGLKLLVDFVNSLED